MLNSENASKKIVQSLKDFVNMTKWLMDENQQPSVTQELGRLFPSIRGIGRRGESSELLRIGAGESSVSATDTNNSFATRSTTKQMIEEIWGAKATSKKPLKSMLHKATSGKTPCNFAFLSHLKPSDMISDLLLVSWYFSSLIFHDCSLKFSKQKVSCFEPFSIIEKLGLFFVITIKKHFGAP